MSPAPLEGPEKGFRGVGRLLPCLAATLLFFSGAGAQEDGTFPTRDAAGENHYFLHPVVTVLSLAIPELPFVAGATYERILDSEGNALVWQPMLMIGDGGEEGRQFGTLQSVGWRKYAHEADRGIYLQGSARLGLGWGSFEDARTGEEESLFGALYGALGYFGYRWSHAFLDFGTGYAFLSGSEEEAESEEDDGGWFLARGLVYDLNLGIGF